MANEKRLIDAKPLMQNGWHLVRTGNFGRFLASMSLADVPVVDAVEVVHGRYEMGIDEGDYEYGTCSVCGYNEYNAFGCCLPHNYCPNCGAKMDGDKDSNLLFADMEEIIDATD